MQIEYKTADADVVEVLDASVGAPRIERAVRVTKALKNMKKKVRANGSDGFSESSTQSTNAPNTTSELNTELFTEVPCQSDGEASPSSPSFPSSTFGRHPNRTFILLYLAVGIAAAVAVVCIAIQKKDKILACIHRKKSGDEEDSLEMENGSAKPTETV